MKRYLLTVAILLAGARGSFAASASLVAVKAYPPEVHLTSSNTLQRLTVQAAYSDGLTREVTAQASLKVANPKLARLDRSSLVAVADGKTDTPPKGASLITFITSPRNSAAGMARIITRTSGAPMPSGPRTYFACRSGKDFAPSIFRPPKCMATLTGSCWRMSWIRWR